MIYRNNTDRMFSMRQLDGAGYYRRRSGEFEIRPSVRAEYLEIARAKIGWARDVRLYLEKVTGWRLP